MGFVGLSTKLLDEETAKKSYKFDRDYNLFFMTQNAFKQPTAKSYVDKLFAEAPQAKSPIQGKLAVVTGVTVGGLGYYIAEELALGAGMSVVLMGRSSNKLSAVEESIKKDAKKRGIDPENVKLYHVLFDLDDLQTAVKAAEETKKLADEHYDGQLHVLVNNAGGNFPTYQTTKQGVEANIGRNFLTPHYLTELLLPQLKKASTPGEYKPRCITLASSGYMFTMDLDPKLLVEEPKFGGAPKDTFKFDANGKCTNGLYDLTNMYGRAKLGDVMSYYHLSKIHPEICFNSIQPGSVVSNFAGNLGVAGYIYYYGFWLFQFSASQGAVSSLRAALDPDFNTEQDLQGAYLHSDGNPWPFEEIKIEDPTTSTTYELEKYAKDVYNAANETIEKVMK